MLNHLPTNKKVVIIGEGKIGKIIADFLISGEVRKDACWWMMGIGKRIVIGECVSVSCQNLWGMKN